MGVPTLSIDYKNHRQVFVEGPSDFYYQRLFDVHSHNREFVFNPYFIMAGNGVSNNRLVKKLVGELRMAGNEKAFGIVDWDWDLKLESTDSILIHGHNVFYSLENCLYNPIYIIQYLMSEDAENIYSQLNLPDYTKIEELGNNFETKELQRLTDWVINKIETSTPTIKSSSIELVDFAFANNKTIRLPIWFLKKKGHDLETLIKRAFLVLANKFIDNVKCRKNLLQLLYDLILLFQARPYEFWTTFADSVKIVNDVFCHARRCWVNYCC